MPKFDFIIGNQPFGSTGGNTLHLKCLDMVYDLFTKKMLMIMPWGFVTKDTRSFKKYQIKFAPKLQYVKEVDGSNFEGTHMPSAAIYEFTNEESEITILEDLSGNKIEKSDLTNVSLFTPYEEEIIKYLESQGQQLIKWGGGHSHCTKNSLNKKGIFDESKINQLIEENVLENCKAIPKDMIYLTVNNNNGGMNGTFISSKVGIIYDDINNLFNMFIDRKISNGYNIICLNSVLACKNCRIALQNPLLRFTCYKLQIDNSMVVNKVYKYIPAIDWEDERCLSDEGILEMCGCPKNKAKKYAEYVKNYVEERDKEIKNRKKSK